MFARQGAHQHRHPLRAARCIRLVRVVDARAPLSVLRPKAVDREDVASCSLQPNPVFKRAPRGTLESRSSIRFSVSREGVAELSLVTSLCSSLRRLQGRADQPDKNASAPWPAPWTRMTMRLGRIIDGGLDGLAIRGSATRHRRRGSSHERLVLVRTEYPAPGALFHCDLPQRVLRVATRIPSREQRTTLLLGEVQGAFHR